jgi:hypothetical protein
MTDKLWISKVEKLLRWYAFLSEGERRALRAESELCKNRENIAFLDFADRLLSLRPTRH